MIKNGYSCFSSLLHYSSRSRVSVDCITAAHTQLMAAQKLGTTDWNSTKFRCMKAISLCHYSVFTKTLTLQLLRAESAVDSLTLTDSGPIF